MEMEMEMKIEMEIMKMKIKNEKGKKERKNRKEKKEEKTTMRNKNNNYFLNNIGQGNEINFKHHSGPMREECSFAGLQKAMTMPVKTTVQSTFALQQCTYDLYVIVQC